MTVDKIARDIWVKSHMAGLLSMRAQQLGNLREERAQISRQISGLRCQVVSMMKRLDKLTVEDDE
jgi:hypothetical protein